MALTLTQLQGIVRTLTKEPYPSSPTYATDANILLYANLAQLDIASRTKSRTYSNSPNSLSDASETTTANQPLYSFPSSLLEIYKVVCNRYELKPVLFDQLIASDPYFWKQTGSSEFYYIRDLSGVRKIGLWPTPGASSLPIVYWGPKRPTDLSAGGDTIDLDERLHMAVAYQISQRMEEYRREFQNADYFGRKVEEELLKYQSSGQDTNEHFAFLQAACPSD